MIDWLNKGLIFTVPYYYTYGTLAVLLYFLVSRPVDAARGARRPEYRHGDVRRP